MSNEVIIDGVNVAECNRFCKTDNYNETNKCWSDISESYSDCKPKEYQCLFYVEQIEKQLQRLKAELTVQKAVAKGFSEGLAQTEKLLEKAKAENEKLKKQINDAEKYIDELQDALRDMEVQKDNIKNLKPIDITEFCKTAERVFDNSNKYKTALEEIRELVSEEIDKTDKDDELISIYGSIYNKINEVLNDVDN
jgi:chromosome segregation ATPase